MSSVVKIENLVKRYKEILALDHFNLEIKEGEIFGLLGPNGSGKTTTINCLLSLLKYDKGEISVFGEKMKPDNYKAKRNIGVVMQNVAVFDELTVYENIDYFCGLYIKDKATRKQYVEEAIDFVGIAEFKKFYPKDKVASSMLLCRGVNFYLFVIISCVIVIISSFRDKRKINENNIESSIDE